MGLAAIYAHKRDSITIYSLHTNVYVELHFFTNFRDKISLHLLKSKISADSTSQWVKQRFEAGLHNPQKAG